MKTRFYFLDLLRFFAAFSVIIYHYFYFAPNVFHLYTSSGNYKSYIDSISTYGYLGVQIFFVISGFIILHTTIDRGAWSFITSRITRLWPALAIASTISYAFYLLLGYSEHLPIISLHNFLYNFFGITISPLRPIFNSGWVEHVLGFKSNLEYVDGAMWTLSREVGFYLLILLLILIKHIKYIHYYALMWLSSSLCIFLFKTSPNVSISGISLYLQMDYASYFTLGIFTYLYFVNSEFLGNKYLGINLNKYIINLGLILSFALSTYSVYDLAYVYNTNNLNIANPAIASIIYSVLYILLICAINTKRVIGDKTIKLLALLGGSSYAIYLIHQFNAYRIMTYMNSKFAWDYIHTIYLMISFITTIIIIHIYIEKPLANAIRKVLKYIKL